MNAIHTQLRSPVMRLLAIDTIFSPIGAAFAAAISALVLGVAKAIPYLLKSHAKRRTLIIEADTEERREEARSDSVDRTTVSRIAITSMEILHEEIGELRGIVMSQGAELRAVRTDRHNIINFLQKWQMYAHFLRRQAVMMLKQHGVADLDIERELPPIPKDFETKPLPTPTEIPSKWKNGGPDQQISNEDNHI